jgi:hypothetical protein
MLGLTLFIESSRGRGFYASPIQNVTIIFAAASRQLHSRWEKSGIKPPPAFEQLRRGRHSKSRPRRPKTFV